MQNQGTASFQIIIIITKHRPSPCPPPCGLDIRNRNVISSFRAFIDTPSFAISRTPGFGYPLREGIEVSLKCDVDSNPSSAPMWQKDDGDPPVRI